MHSTILTVVILAISIYGRVFDRRLWWAVDGYSWFGNFSSEERWARWWLLLAMIAVMFAIFFGGVQTAIAHGAGKEIWCAYSLVVGIYLARPICTLFCSDLIKVADENAEKRSKSPDYKTLRWLP